MDGSVNSLAGDTRVPRPLGHPRPRRAPLSGEDAATMKRAAIAWLREACGSQWTHFNESDPGVMLLEALIYGLTDLAYQARRPLERLLRDDEGRFRSEDQSFHPAKTILAMDPLTHEEDAAWLQATYPEIRYVEFCLANEEGRSLAGCWEALLVFNPDVPPTARARIADGALRLLQSKRRLGERLLAVKTAPVISVSLEVLLQLTPDANRARLRATLYREIDDALGFPPTQSAAEAGINATETAALLVGQAEETTAADSATPAPGGPIRWSEAETRIVARLQRLPGVAAVSGVRPRDAASAPSPNQRAFFALAAEPSSDLAARPLKSGEWWAVTKSSVSPSAGNKLSSPFASKNANPGPGSESGRLRPRLSGEYRSIQYDLPRIFGLRDDGLERDLAPEEQSRVAQLKGYLLVFEQLLADYLAQLSRVGDYFSVRPQDRTRFTQPLRSVPGVERLLMHAVEETDLLPTAERAAQRRTFWAKSDNPHLRALAERAEGPLEFEEHRKRVLDHLLARFGETLPSDDPANCPTLTNREAYLRQIDELGRSRARGLDASRVPAALRPRPRSGLEEKMRLLLQTDRQSPLPALADLTRDPGAEYLGDFYFIIEPVLWLDSGPAAEVGLGEKLLLPRAAFESSLVHVVLSWTPCTLSPEARVHVRTLLRDHAPAHLWPRFVWVDTLEQRREFLIRYRDWALAGYPPLVALRTVLDAKENVAVERFSTAGRLAEWLKQNDAWKDQ